MNILIGLSGKPRSGKDTVGDFLVNNHGFKKFSFASYLKWVSYSYFDFPREVLWGKKTKESRKFLQQLGKLLTDIDTNIFVDKVVSSIKEEYNENENNEFNVVITDVRRKDELSLFDRSGVTFLVPDDISDGGVALSNMFDKIVLARIDRDINTILKEEPGLKANINHPVEQLDEQYSEWDYLIDNNSNIESLEASVNNMIMSLRGDPSYDNNKG